VNLLHNVKVSFTLEFDVLHSNQIPRSDNVLGIPYLHHGDDSQSECANSIEERYLRCSHDILQSICRYCSVVENPVSSSGGVWGHRTGGKVSGEAQSLSSYISG
jgi:hypothetical protein